MEKATIKSSAQREAELANEIRAAQVKGPKRGTTLLDRRINAAKAATRANRAIWGQQ